MTAAPTPTSTAPASGSQSARQATGLLTYLLVGVYFGTVLVKSEAASWYRIQEMFRFQDFHMFGLIGSAVLTGLVTTTLLRRFGHTRDGDAVHVADKEPGWKRYVLGGGTFGLGWGLAGVCPGPVFVLLGSGVWGMLVVLAFALLGTYLYGTLRDRLPH
ncbi:protein of unknown function DUF395 YeeE/YedE [Deinococcus proteolyticus MRP]|uniref:Uncharacterized protein n=1 Tax=Deinococcus proteolyticus (strain ATCC 35074 / DSM 20540 / JCM 6276 / NBRC 101906 / NCIMB 13154 / VKM Ac-1939 / CCM 2703 / MRP) TaxID=693977 RepID=F0RNP2_DEIPM|nr:DUF6691 family protein [Deinococcus proteolyticus]ADY25275.1 protein of unknown function DUF395 YeeE/YedE [Deinococcus proteolyticus MRP]